MLYLPRGSPLRTRGEEAPHAPLPSRVRSEEGTPRRDPGVRWSGLVTPYSGAGWNGVASSLELAIFAATLTPDT